MIVLGLLLVLLTLVVVVAVVLNGNDPAQIDLDWFIFNTDVTGIFTTGALTLLVGVFGLSLLTSGLKRSRRKRAEVNALKAQAGGKSTPVSPAPARSSSSRSDSASRPVSDSSSRRAPAASTGSASSGSERATTSDAATGASPADSADQRPGVENEGETGEAGDGPDEYFQSAPRDR